MSRDHRKLRAFELGDQLAIEVYRVTQKLPADERFGLTSQLRRAAVSIPTNIVEGCGRSTDNEYVRFLDIAMGSAREVNYLLSLTQRLDYFKATSPETVLELSEETCRVLSGLIRSLRKTNP